MSLKNINAALVTAFQSAMSTLGEVVPVAYEGRDFSPPANGKWLQIFNVPAERAVATLGTGGEDNLAGFFQINIYTPENTGTAPIYDLADHFLRFFQHGKILTYSGTEVRVHRSEATGIQKGSNSASQTISLTFYWNSRKQREV